MTSESQKICDKAITKAAKAMMGSADVPLELFIDRLLTFAAAQMVAMSGKAHASEVFRRCARSVETGMFDKYDPTVKPKH